VAAVAISADIQRGEGRFRAAATSATEALMKLPSFGRIWGADTNLASIALGSRGILGDKTPLADDITRRFVLSEPTRLGRVHYAPFYATEACLHASKPIAVACFDRLERLLEDGYFISGVLPNTLARIEGGKRFVAGDLKGAIEAWRPLLLEDYYAPGVVPAALDELGDTELASRLDTRWMKYAKKYIGATLSHVREAKRALARKD
jgi:hypothetical protein